MEKEKLVELAFEARENAYVPYSHFRVGACVALKDGKYADCEPIASPCGACRQVLSELLDLDIPIYLSNKKVIETHTMRELMPMVFIGESL